MAGIDVKLHPFANFAFKPLGELIGVVHVEAAGSGENGGQPQPPKGLAFTDPDGETHVYVFTEEGRANLVAMLTGGIVIPGQ